MPNCFYSPKGPIKQLVNHFVLLVGKLLLSAAPGFTRQHVYAELCRVF